MLADIIEMLPTIFLILIAVFFFITILFVYRQYTTMNRLLEAQASKRGGTVERKYSTRYLRFLYHDFSMVLSAHQGSRYQPPETKVSVMLHTLVPSKVTIYHESLASRIGKALGSQDIQTGSDEFNREYMLKGDDELFVQNLVTLTIQEKLLDIKPLRPYILLSGTTLDVLVHKVLNTDEQYDHLIDLTTALIERLQEIQ
jgi:hypothetical protein